MDTSLKVLLVEDSDDDALLILRELRTGSYIVAHTRVETESAMREALSSQRWDVVFSDYHMPDFSGLEALSVFKESGIEVPFIIISGAIGEESAVQLMKEGAYDYVMKDNLKRLVPVLERALREAEGRKSRRIAEQRLDKSYRKLQETFEQTVNALSALVEMRDPYTAGHQRRVAKIARGIGQELELASDVVQGIWVASLIHDIGKIRVPADILSRPGRLSAAEFSVIKEHPQTGYEILRGIDFPWPIADIVLQHHERIDGSGYPQGLKGEAILLESKIISIADVVEAIATHRPYREGLGIDAALEEIRVKKGIFYDPLVVDACLTMFLEKGFTLD